MMGNAIKRCNLRGMCKKLHIPILMQKGMSRVTKKQKIFVDEYLIDLNATRAYMAAYPNVKNPNVAAAAATRLLRNVKVSEEIKKRMNERSERIEITQDMVLKELAAVAFAKYTDYGNVIERQAYYTDKKGMNIPLTDRNGKPLMIKDVDYELTEPMSEWNKKAIKSIKPGRYGIKLELHDKERALELLGRHLGMFTGTEESDDNIDDGFIEAIKSTAGEDWSDED